MSEKKRKTSEPEPGCCAAEKKSKVEATLPKMSDMHQKHEPYPQPKIVSHEEFMKARRDLIEEEKQLTRMQEAMTKKRQKLPWTKVDDYVFDYVDGEGKASKQRLSQAFGDKNDLIVWHFMLPGADGKSACSTCSGWCDGFNGYLPHINALASFVAIAKAPAPELAALTKHKGWNFKMLSSQHNTFNKDFNVEPTDEENAAGKAKSYNYGYGWPFAQVFPQMQGISFFHVDKDKKIFRTDSAYARGIEQFNAVWALIDRLPQGRNGFWFKHKGEY